MDAFFKDFKMGNFIASENNLMVASVDYSGSETEDFGIGSELNEEYIGNKTIPLDYGSNHHGKLKFSITMVHPDGSPFTIFETRAILRELTGKKNYTDLYFIDYEMHYDEKIHYRVKVTSTERLRVAGNIDAIILYFECDSFWAYTDEIVLSLSPIANNSVLFYNSSDELNDYLYPTIEITSDVSIQKLIITNKSDNERQTVIENLENTEVVSLDSKNEIATTSFNKNIVDNFNLKWLRLIPGKNEIIFSNDCKVKIKYTLLRKVVL